MRYPAAIAVDEANNIYVSSENKIQKFASNGKLLHFTGERGEREGEFHDPRGLAIYNDQLYVSDRKNHRIQVFDLELTFKYSIGSHGKDNGKFDEPFDVKFDSYGRMYVAEFNNKRVQVMDTTGQYLMIGQNEAILPTALYITDGKVYVSDFKDDCIMVYDTSGKDITRIGSRGCDIGELRSPYGITSCDDQIYVCDSSNNRVHAFNKN